MDQWIFNEDSFSTYRESQGVVTHYMNHRDYSHSLEEVPYGGENISKLRVHTWYISFATDRFNKFQKCE